MDTAETGPVLAVAAQAREFSGLLRHAGGLNPLDAPVRTASMAVISDRQWLLVTNGEGPRSASLAMDWALSCVSPRAVVSTGYCGALDPELAEGDLFAATVVLDGGGTRFPALPPSSSRTARHGTVLSIDRVATTAGEKAHLRSTGAEVVEMEAAAVARAAGAHQIPFYCIRVVSDSANGDLPIDFNQFRDLDGRVDTRRVARNVALRPWLWPGLVHLARSASRASQLLGDYLADCRF